MGSDVEILVCAGDGTITTCEVIVRVSPCLDWRVNLDTFFGYFFGACRIDGASKAREFVVTATYVLLDATRQG